MAFLFNKEKNKYIELNLFTTNEKDWIAYSMCGGNIYQQTRKELFRLDNEIKMQPSRQNRAKRVVLSG